MTLSSDAQIPPWIKRAPQFYREGMGAPGLAWAISSTGPLWSNPYGAPVLCPDGMSGRIAFLYEPGFFVGIHDATENGIALGGRIRSRWWVRVTEDTPAGWYDWDGTGAAAQPIINGNFEVGDEIIVMHAGYVRDLTGEKRPVVRGAHNPIVPAMGVVNNNGDSADTWVVHDWVVLPKSVEEIDTSSKVEAVEEIEKRISAALGRVRQIAQEEEYCDEYEYQMERLGLRKEDYRKGPRERSYKALVKLTYILSADTIATWLSNDQGGAHEVNGSMQVVSRVEVAFDWDGQDEDDRDDLIEAAVDEETGGYDYMEVMEVTER